MTSKGLAPALLPDAIVGFGASPPPSFRLTNADFEDSPPGPKAGLALPALPDSAVDSLAPPSMLVNDAEFETPPGPKANLLLPTPPGITIIAPTPDMRPGSSGMLLGSPLVQSMKPGDMLLHEEPESEDPGDEERPGDVKGTLRQPASFSSLSAPEATSRPTARSSSVSSRTSSLSPSEAAMHLERRRSSLSTTMEFQAIRRKSTGSLSIPSIISRVDRLEDYSFLDKHKLGGGATAQVVPAVFKPTKTPCAVKELYKDGYNARFTDVRQQWKDEIALIKMVDKHPNVVTVLDAWEGAAYFYTVMDLCLGGDLQSLVDKSGPWPESQAALLMAILINALNYIHQVGILHRDFRPPNILFLNKERRPAESVIIDFGIAALLPPDGKPLKEFNIGAPFYRAPELFEPNSPGYGPASDLFSAGGVAQFVLTGSMPGAALPPSLSADAVNFIERLRDPDQFTRMTAEQALVHPWILQSVDESTLEYLKTLNDAVLAGKVMGQRTATFSKSEKAANETNNEGEDKKKKKGGGFKKFLSKLFKRSDA